ncbi:phage tail domain-containing protein [Isoptericola dokdonensis]|uniref:Phage tail protein n=1 Tax=Isoptericola dokdonensis DS-3 TaxID=1300344 RepID=A0A168FDC7_9MICO|nr:phage tail domain-containing protein [Isoptericola dokdonensis]ANC31426.1 hypothetical protein I598_1878 [Isoptericola dokdonensis DS-3]
MVTLALQLAGATDAITLTEYVPGGGDAFIARGFEGAGFPDIETHWFDAAGEGAVFRGARPLPRDFKLPLRVVGENREQVAETLSRIALLLDPRMAPPSLRVVEPTGDAWSTQVVRTGKADWAWGTDTNGRTYVKTTVPLRGSPFWTRERPSDFKIETGSGTARGLLTGPLSALRLTSGQAQGARTITVAGDAVAYPTITVTGPGDHLVATSPSGETISWDGSLVAGEKLIIDHSAGTVVDGTGANRYSELGTAPRFWALPPGKSTVSVALANASPGTIVGGKITRKNLVPTPSFEDGVGNWGCNGGTLTVGESFPMGGKVGSSYLQATSNGATATMYPWCEWPIDPAEGGWFAYRLWYAHDVTGNPRVRQVVYFYDEAGTLLTSPAAEWQTGANFYAGRLRTFSGQVPANAERMRIYLTMATSDGTNLPADRRLWLDQVHVEQAATQADAEAAVDRYFDGSTPNTGRFITEWTGPVHASASIERAAVNVDRTEILVQWRPRKWVMF